MYADRVTDSMQRAIDETNRRRKIQKEFNDEHGIVPTTIKKSIRDVIEATKPIEEEAESVEVKTDTANIELTILKLTDQMNEAARQLNFEKAAKLRDKIQQLRNEA